MRIAVVGATSRTGRHLLAQGVERGYDMVALTRRPEALADPSELAFVVSGDGRDHDAVARVVKGADAVVSLVSGGGRRDRSQAADVTRTITEAMAAHGVRRLVVTSAYPIVAREPRVPLWLLRRVFATSYADAAAMERGLIDSDLDWTVVRLNRLTDAAASGAAVASRDLLPAARSLSRADAASVLLDAVVDPEAVRAAINVAGL